MLRAVGRRRLAQRMAFESAEAGLHGLLRAVAPRLVAAIYTGGCVAHLLRLLVGFGWRDMPFLVDWLLVLLGPVGLLGLVLLAGEVDYRGRWERLTHWLIVVHLAVSVAVHVAILAERSHRLLAVFPRGYSFPALLYFALFAWRSWTLRLLPPRRAPETTPGGIAARGPAGSSRDGTAGSRPPGSG